MNQRYRRPLGGKCESVEDGAVPTAEDRHRQPGEFGKMRLNQIGDISAERTVGCLLELASTRPCGHQQAPSTVAVRAGLNEPIRRVQPGYRLTQPQAITEGCGMAGERVNHGFVALICNRHVAHRVGNLVDLASDLGGGLEHHDVELDVVALDGGTHTRGAGSDDNHIAPMIGGHAAHTIADPTGDCPLPSCTRLVRGGRRAQLDKGRRGVRLKQLEAGHPDGDHRHEEREASDFDDSRWR